MKIKEYILERLQKAGSNGLAGGIIEDYIRDLTGSKASTASRVCRLLYNEKKLQRQYINGNVWYRIK